MIVFSNSDSLEVNEGDGQIIVEIDPIASEITEPVEVEITTIDGAAVSTPLISDGLGLDFDAIDNSIVPLDPDNSDTLTFTINLVDDSIIEPDEDFQFQVTALEDEALNGTTSILIVDNDSEAIAEPELLPEITVANVEQLEGDIGTTNFEFVVSLSQASDEVVTVDFFTSDVTAEFEEQSEGLTLIDAADYVPVDGTLEFAPGETEATIVVEVLTDDQPLDSETAEERFLLNLTNVTNAELAQLAATGTIIDDDINPDVDDEIPLLEVENQFFLEGDFDQDIAQDFTVSLVDVDGELVTATEDINFSFSTVDVTTSADVDYEFIASETATIEAGQSSTTVSITTFGDIQTEIDETLFVVFTDFDPNLVQLRDGGTELITEVTIVNDDAISDSDFTPDEESDDDDLDSDVMGNTVFRFLDSDTGAYFYTDSVAEQESIATSQPNFIQEDSSFASVDPDSSDVEVDVFQLFNTETGGYLYTRDVQERDFILANSPEFLFEEVAFSAFETEIGDAIPVFRFFETNAGVHFYTANEAERTFIEENLPNFNFEGIAFFGLPLESV